MKQIVFSLLFSAMTATTAMAVPALSQWFTHVQPDGTTLRLRLVGDELFSYYETEDGMLMKQTADGNYEPTDDNSYSLEWKRALAADLSQRRNERNSLSPSMRQAISDGTRKKGLVIIMQFPDHPSKIAKFRKHTHLTRQKRNIIRMLFHRLAPST